MASRLGLRSSTARRGKPPRKRNATARAVEGDLGGFCVSRARMVTPADDYARGTGELSHVRNRTVGLRRLWTISHGRLDHSRHCLRGRGRLAPAIRSFVTSPIGALVRPYSNVSVVLLWQAPLGNPPRLAFRQTLPLSEFDIRHCQSSLPWGCCDALAPSAMRKAVGPCQTQ